MWTYGNRVRLLENGEQYFPAVFAAIRSARREVRLETFILFDDVVGRELKSALIAAASRGAAVDVTIDGYGSPDLPESFRSDMARAGIRLHLFDPRPRLLGMRTNVLRRLHRKLVVVDRRLAFVGGLNYSEDQLAESGPLAKQDYAVEVEGPVVDQIYALMVESTPDSRPRRLHAWWHRVARPSSQPDATRLDDAAVMLVHRDNQRHRDDIESQYRSALRAARRDVLIANAYFFPGYRLLRELRLAAARGVRVQLILQGTPDRPLVRWATQNLYDFLLRSGVSIHEYCTRPFHGKVAVIDDDWATIGSSNLDPSSLSLNLEANLVLRDKAFNTVLRERLEHLLTEHCEDIRPTTAERRTLWRRLIAYLVFHLARRIPRWIGWLPMRRQDLVRDDAAALHDRTRDAA